MDWRIQALNLRKEDKGLTEISNMLGVKYHTLRSFFYRYHRLEGSYEVNPNSPLLKSTTRTEVNNKDYDKGLVMENNREFIKDSLTITADGTRTYDVEQKLLEGKEITPETIMRAKGLKPEEWYVDKYFSNIYQQQNKYAEVIDLCQSKLIVKPRKDTSITFEMIDKYFENIDRRRKVKPIEVAPFKVGLSDNVLEIDIADLHCGLLSYASETGEAYNLDICVDRFIQCIIDVVNWNIGRGLKKVYLCSLGDILHIDNDKNTTNKGTPQDASGRLTEIFSVATDMMVTAIDTLMELGVPIEYIHLSGNHDRNTGYFLAKCLELTYKDNPNIKFDITPNPQKAIHFGKVLVGLSHGDMNRKNSGRWLLDDYRSEFGESRFVEEHCGHLHDEEVKVINGVKVRTVLAQTAQSFWEHQQGYRGMKGMQAFLWNEDIGLRTVQYYNI